ncbi:MULTISPECIES: AbiTii domain-containing protein [Paenibacillus]|uniref:AbiTii domain-containing protein n=1 Tax=Paenibacillus TaxID=44249 RepID=UPI00096F6655|nr:hypothetical protein [Paenibacillus odorifer]OME07501.1 hypothetical protein BSK60_31275 [Paenibacillus odorifer]
MSSMVLELQREAYEQKTSVSILLRKAYTLAKKLQVTELDKWATLELNGYYQEGVAVPEYRKVYGEVKGFNPYSGYIPTVFNQSINELITQRVLDIPITEIEDQVNMANSKKSQVLLFNYPPQIQSELMRLTGVELQFSLHVTTAQFQKIIDKVRNIILEWTLDLEGAGVMGEGMTFNSEEKDRAAKAGDTIINNIGSMTNSQLQQKAIESTQSQVIQSEVIQLELGTVIEDVKKLLEEIKDQAIKDELASDIEVLESQAKSPKPKQGIIKEALKSIRNIAEGVTGSLLASVLQGKITAFLATLL